MLMVHVALAVLASFCFGENSVSRRSKLDKICYQIKIRIELDV
jgi:hypothetical protein